MAETDSRYSRQVPSDRALRACDRDREAVGDILRREHVAGRLDVDEFAERYGRCLEAKTYAELDALVADLPIEERPVAQTRPAARTGALRGAAWQAPRAWQPGRRLWPTGAVMWLAVVAVLFAVSGGHLFWLGFPLFWFFFWGPRRCRGSWHQARRWQGLQHDDLWRA